MRVLLKLALAVLVAATRIEASDGAENARAPAADTEPAEVHIFLGAPPLTAAKRLAILRGSPEIATMYQRLASGGPNTEKLINWGSVPLWIVFFDAQGWTLSAYRLDPDLRPQMGVRPCFAGGTRELPSIGANGRAFVVPPLAIDTFLKAAGIEAKDGQVTRAWLKQWGKKPHWLRCFGEPLSQPPRILPEQLQCGRARKCDNFSHDPDNLSHRCDKLSDPSHNLSSAFA